MQIVTSTRQPHEWRRDGPNWRCAVCNALAAEFDPDGRPEPYGLIYYLNKRVGLELQELTCEELAIFKVMDS